MGWWRTGWVKPIEQHTDSESELPMDVVPETTRPSRTGRNHDRDAIRHAIRLLRSGTGPSVVRQFLEEHMADHHIDPERQTPKENR